MLRPFRSVSPSVHRSAYVDVSAQVIGDVHIGPESSVWMNVVVRGDVHFVRIGARTNIQDLALVHVMRDTHPTVIGDDVTIGHGAVVHGCTIEDLCLIGMGARILDGATVKKYGFVGAGAVVGPGKVVGEAELWLGNPARLVRRLSDREIESLHYSAAHYVRLKDRYLAPAQG